MGAGDELVNFWDNISVFFEMKTLTANRFLAILIACYDKYGQELLVFWITQITGNIFTVLVNDFWIELSELSG